MNRPRAALTSLRRTLRDERGTLIELNILIAFVLVSLALIPAYHSVWKAFLFGALYFGGGLTILMVLVFLCEKASDLAALQPVVRLLESSPVQLLFAACHYLTGAVSCAIVASFLSLFIAPRLSATPQGQLAAMRAIVAAGAAAGLGVVYALRRQGPRF